MSDHESELAKFQEAERLWDSGDHAAALRVHIGVCMKAADARVRFLSAGAVVDRLKFPEAPELLLQACGVGIEAARQLADPRHEARFLAKRAEYIVALNMLTLVPARKRLRMAPGWFGFSLCRDEEQWRNLTNQTATNDEDADRQIADALKLCDERADRSTKGHVLMSAGSLAFQRYMGLKVEALPPRTHIPGWLLARLRELCLDEYVLYDSVSRHRMQSLVRECEAAFLEAAAQFREAGEDEMAGYAFYNLANNLRSAFRFRRATRYLRTAREVAERHGNKELLRGVSLLEKSIAARNRDTPNYAAGEQRPAEELP